MAASPDELLAPWQDFFVVAGTAAATLIGAMFVVVSIGTAFLTPERSAGVRTFLTSSVVHLSTVLLLSLLMMVPKLGAEWAGAIVAAGGALGLGETVRNLLNFRRHNDTEASDFVWYVVVPLLAYAALAGAGAMLLWRLAAGADLLAAAGVLLLMLGIRNAWDMLVFIVIRTDPRG